MSKTDDAIQGPLQRLVLPAPYYERDGITIYHGNSAEILPNLSGLDACVTDPPYGLSFMGKAWDYDVPTAALWSACLAALKPGAHLLAFAGTRTQHRMAVNIEDAGFEIRDMIAWVYGQGFPKSLDVSKAIDKAAGAEREVIGQKTSGIANKDEGPRHTIGASSAVTVDITAPATDAAKQWHGWGTALKPALEPITMARKPLIGTVTENVLTHGTGAINVDGCRVGMMTQAEVARSGMSTEGMFSGGGVDWKRGGREPTGRFPANLIHDGSEDVTGLFPQAGGGFGERRGRAASALFNLGATHEVVGYGDSGSAARFFYCAKASKSDRGEGNNHPTVKPVDLMRYLVRLVCRPGGTVLEPFMGSGTTLLAAKLEGRRAIGIEIEERYCELAARRLSRGALL